MITKNSKQPFYLGDWCVIPEACQLQNSETNIHIQPKLMEVLLYLVEHPLQVVSTDQLIAVCWMGQPMSDNPIHKTIAQLRKALGDSSESPQYIRTIPRKGYMLIAEVGRSQAGSAQTEPYWCDQPPFLGCKPFQSHHQKIFFGRQQPVADFLKYIEGMEQPDNLLINLSGVSGCGKSSFIQAGIIPRLLNPYKPFKFKFKEAIIWQVNSNNSINDLLHLLAQKKVFKSAYSKEDILQQWQHQPDDFHQLIAVKDNDTKERCVLFIDQLEKWLVDEVGGGDKQNSMQSLFELIAVLYRSQQFFIIFSARDEANKHIKQLDAYQALSAVTIDFRLPVMQLAQHRDWLQRTMQAAGLFFEMNPNRHETLFELLNHSIERYQCGLFLIQTFMLNLYGLRDNSKLQYASYHKLGGIEGITNNYFKAVFKTYSAEQKATITQLFPKLVALKSILDNRVTNQKIPLDACGKALDASLLNQLIDDRLLTSEQLNNQLLIGFSEPSLSLLWSRLSKWVVDHKNQLLKQSEVQFMTARWLHKNQQADYLMADKDLHQINQDQSTGYFLTAEQQHYLKASAAKATRGLKVKRSVQVVMLVLLISSSVLITAGLKGYFLQQKTQNQLHDLINYLTVELSPKLKSQGQLDVLESMHSELLVVINKALRDNPKQPHLTSHAAVLNTMGELSFNRRDSATAVDYFSQAEKIIQQSGETSNPALLAQLMLSQYWLGYLGFVENQFAQAKQYWQSYLESSLRLRRLEPNSTEWQLEHSYALNNLGSLSERTGAFQQAADYFAESVAIKTALLKAQPDNMSLQADLADSLSWQGNIYRKQGALKMALSAYQDSVDLTQQMKADKQNSNIKLHRESLALHRMATLLLDMGALSEAQNLALVALDKVLLLNQLELRNTDYKKELTSLHLFNAHIYRQTKDFDSSLKHIQKANQLIDYFKINLTMTAQIATYQMWLKREQALIFEHFNQTDSAITALQNGLSTWQEYQLKDNHLAQVAYVMLHLNMSQIMQQNPLHQSNQSYQKNVQKHLDQAWQKINSLLIKSPADHQLMAIKVAVAYARSDQPSQQQFVQTLIQSEYRNPEYYQPLIDAQLISYN